MKYKLRDNFSTDPNKALIDILKNRGVKDITNFLKPSPECELNPYDLENIEEAAKLLLKHLRNNSHICFIVDCDVDGYTSASLLWLYIRGIFSEADLNFTVHEHKQHGLDDKIDWLINDEQFDLVLCPDSASFNIEEHKQLHEIGTDVIVLDHHEIPKDNKGNDIKPNNEYAIVVNNQLSPKYTNKSLCGVGVVYKFCQVLDDILGIKQAHNYIDLVALGEIADVMDRADTETNYIMMEGLKKIQNKGFRTLIEAQSYSLKDKAIYPYKGLTPIDIAFYIAPLLNAITRVGTMTEKENMFYCFTEPMREVQSTKRGAKPGDIEYAAEATARCGANAKARQNRIKEKAMDLIDFKIQKNNLDANNIIIIELDPKDDIPPEMTGLIAMAVVSKYHKPVMIGRINNNKEEISGSIRSDGNFEGLPSFKQFLENSGFISYVAGHDNAAGASVQMNKIDSLMEYANEKLDASDFENCYIADYILNASNDNEDLLYELASHPEYFGNHIEEITVVVKNIPLSNILEMGAAKDSLKISYNGIDYIKFKDMDFVYDIKNNRMKKLTVIGRLNINFWGGREMIQLFISDYDFEDNSKYDF